MLCLDYLMWPTLRIHIVSGNWIFSSAFLSKVQNKKHV